MTVVAFVGQNGIFGQFAFKELQRSNYINVIRSFSRNASTAKGHSLAVGPKVEHRHVDYMSEDSLRRALEGCQILISCMGTEGDYMVTKKKLVEAAAKTTTVRFYIASDYGVDHQVPGTDLFQHKCWIDKADHQQYAESLGLQTVSLYIGLFLQNPWGFADIWHGLDKRAHKWYVAGAGDEPVTLTSKSDVARSIRRVCEMLLSDPRSVPRTLRLKGTNHTPQQIVAILNKVCKRAGKSRTWTVQPLLSEREIQMRLKEQACIPEDPAELALLGPGFDPVFASEISERIFRAMGQGFILGSQEIDNELINPNESEWRWDSVESYFEEVEGDI